MDIFTTQLTRVVPVPIKPASLKVKALLKEAGTSKLKEDPDHLENHDYYFTESKEDNQTDNEQQTVQTKTTNATEQDETTNEQLVDSETKDKVKHLDLYV